MIRVSVFYPSSGPESFDFGYYFDKHYKLVCDKLKPEGMIGAQFDRGLADGGGGKAPFHAVAHLLFPSVEAFQGAMGKVGGEIMADIPNYTKIAPVIQVNEVAAG